MLTAGPAGQSGHGGGVVGSQGVWGGLPADFQIFSYSFSNSDFILKLAFIPELNSILEL